METTGIKWQVGSAGLGFVESVEEAIKDRLSADSAFVSNVVVGHAAVRLRAELVHLGAFVGGAELPELYEVRFDSLGEREVLADHGPVSDAGVVDGHCPGLLAEQRGD